MDDMENLRPITRASKKRSVENLSPPATAKRVVLGDITNKPKVVSKNKGPIDAQKSKSKSALKIVKKKSELKKRTGKEAEEVKVDPEIDIKGCTDDGPHKYADAPLIYRYLQEMEESSRPIADYMEKVQKDINPAMREILVDWLSEVADDYKLVSDTLYLSVSYIDRFLSSSALRRTKLQLLGVSCMLVASKYEEITPPHVEDFCYMTDNTYTKQEVTDMEIDVLKVLNYVIGNPTTKSFLRIFTKAAQDDSAFSDLDFEFMASYIADLSLLDYLCVRFLPSMIAASAIFLARMTMQPDTHPWSLALEKYTGYRASELEECVLTMHDVHTGRRCVSVQAIRVKYMQHKFKCVAALTPPSEIPKHYFHSGVESNDKDCYGS